jgi:superfamily II DNA/RNA helicase
VDADSRLPVITDLAAAPGRTVIFTRTKHGAKALARKLNARGVTAVELHGNLAQNARSRNLESFASGKAMTLVATDIAARGIHVDDISLVIHADPPMEHKAYLHRSGRTARAGAEGTVVTMMLDAQVRDVRDLTRKAGIKPATTRVKVGDPILRTVAPGERAYSAPMAPAAPENIGRTTGRSDNAGSGSRSGRGRGRRGAATPGGKSGGAGTSGRGGQRRRGKAPTQAGPSRGHSAASFSAGARRG